jgi:hypothetical protein
VCSNDQSDCWSNTVEEEDEVSLEFDDLSKDVDTVDIKVKDGGKEVRLPIVFNGVKYGEVIFEADSLEKGWTALITKVDSKTLEKVI